jgi:hypothetical protein
MKRILAVLVILAILPATGRALYSSLDIALTSQEPFPAEPGKTVELEIEIQNNGAGEARGTEIEMLLSPPFKLLPGEERKKTFSLIPAMSSVKTSYRLFIDEDAVTNDYEVEFTLSLGSARLVKDVFLSVRGKPEIIIDDVSIFPEKPEAGGEAHIKVYAKNVGTGTARHFALLLNSTPEIIPVLSGGNVYLGDLAPGSAAIAEMKVNIDKSAEEKTFPAVLGVSYLDESNTPIAKAFPLGIPVAGAVRLDIIKVEPDYERDTIEIEVANKGTTEAKSVEARLFHEGNLLDIDYISQIKPTKKTTFSFPLVKGGRGELEINYIGPGLEESNITKPIVFSFRSNSDSGSDPSYVAVLAAIIIAALYFWRRRARKK